MPVVWQAGTSRLLDYGMSAPPSDAPPILVIPSLVNRYTILDLSADHSLLRYLASDGLHPFVMDWQAPGSEEQAFDLTHYMTERLEPALDAVIRLTGQKPMLVGYCMGGLLALALAVLKRDAITKLALMATPWDFHTAPASERQALAQTMGFLEPVMTRLGVLPTDVLQGLFWSRAPFLAGEKFRAFANIDPESPRGDAFVRLEDWLNDGVPLAAPVAKECLCGWYLENQPSLGTWEVANTPISPEQVQHHTLVMIPENDHIVPPESALPLAKRLPHANVKRLKAGHIGMVAGGRAKQQTFRPLSSWLKAPITSV